MNLEREREIFIDWHFNKYYAKDADKEFLYEMFEDKNEFVSYEVQHSWDAWLASASREGYKMVPINCTNNMAHAAKEVDGRLSAFKYSDVWGAMLGAVDET